MSFLAWDVDSAPNLSQSCKAQVHRLLQFYGPIAESQVQIFHEGKHVNLMLGSKRRPLTIDIDDAGVSCEVYDSKLTIIDRKLVRFEIAIATALRPRHIRFLAMCMACFTDTSIRDSYKLILEKAGIRKSHIIRILVAYDKYETSNSGRNAVEESMQEHYPALSKNPGGQLLAMNTAEHTFEKDENAFHKALKEGLKSAREWPGIF